MPGKIQNAFYEDEMLRGSMTKVYKWGETTSWATVDAEDMDIANQWDCYRLCDYKCDYKALLKKARVMSERARGMEIAYDNLKNSLDEKSLSKLHRQVKVAKRDADKVRRDAINMKKNYQKYADSVTYNRRKIRNSPRPTENKGNE